MDLLYLTTLIYFITPVILTGTMLVYIYIFLRIHIYVYTSIYIYFCKYIYTCSYNHAHTRIHMCLYVWARMYVYDLHDCVNVIVNYKQMHSIIYGEQRSRGLPRGGGGRGLTASPPPPNSFGVCWYIRWYIISFKYTNVSALEEIYIYLYISMIMLTRSSENICNPIRYSVFTVLYCV